MEMSSNRMLTKLYGVPNFSAWILVMASAIRTSRSGESPQLCLIVKRGILRGCCLFLNIQIMWPGTAGILEGLEGAALLLYSEQGGGRQMT